MISKILIATDSHRNFETIEEIVKFENPDCFIFCGDLVKDISNVKINGEIIAVKGNRDFGSKEKTEKVFEINGNRILITHGYKYNIKRDLSRLKARAAELKCNLVCYGHTHIQNLEVCGNITFVNSGFAKMGYYAMLELDEKKVNVKLKKLNK